MIAVTGATGWFGRTTLELLYTALGDPASTQVVAYGSRGGRIGLSTGHSVPVRPLHDLPTDLPSPTVVLHFACLTKDKVGELGRAPYLQANLEITTTVLRALERHSPRILMATSSGAAAQYGDASGLDLDRNPYGALKRLDELAFCELAGQLGVSYAIPRVYSVAGPWMTKPTKYALGAMIAMSRAGGPLTITATRPTWRSYSAVAEVVVLSLWMATHGRNVVFDTGGHVVEMADLAEAVARIVGGAPVNRPVFEAAAKPDRYVGDPAVYEEGIRQAGLSAAPLDELVRSTSTGVAASPT